MDINDLLESDLHSMLTRCDELVTAKNGRTIKASRTRQKLNNKSVVECLEDWAVASTPTEGFQLLVQAGLVELTGEYLVLKYPEKFTTRAIDHARRRLKEVGWEGRL
ncbi:MAG: hypothetical protein RJQ21_20485 [Rhodospirillales bacterium]